MFKAGEMQIEAVGLKYLKSYPTIASMNEDYEQAHPDKLGITKFPPAYWAFANYLRNGDVVIACSTSSNVLAWGIIESQYFFKPTRKKEDTTGLCHGIRLRCHTFLQTKELRYSKFPKKRPIISRKH